MNSDSESRTSTRTSLLKSALPEPGLLYKHDVVGFTVDCILVALVNKDYRFGFITFRPLSVFSAVQYISGEWHIPLL